MNEKSPFAHAVIMYGFSPRCPRGDRHTGLKKGGVVSTGPIRSTDVHPSTTNAWGNPMERKTRIL